MTGKFREWWKTIVVSHRTAVLVVAVVIGLLVVYNGAFFVAAYFPNSCRACHYMEPYVDKWKASAHADVT